MLPTRGFDWVRASTLPTSPDTASPVYPDRPIRPLPKQRIKSRLSLEQADAIIFPPIASSSSPLFGSPQSQSERSFVNPHYYGNVDVLQDDHDLEHVCDCGGHHSGPESDEEEELKERPAHRNSWPGRMMRLPRDYQVERAAPRSKPLPPKSTGSSADGYESFENTNNKKKRKIPISGALGTVSTAESTGMNIPTQSVDVSLPQLQNGNLGPYYAPSSGPYSSGSGIGISGAGRGRHSKTNIRILSERRPLVSSNNGANTLPDGSPADRQGIISAAIANATENGHTIAPTGKENISLLQRQQPSSSVPKDFTFECPSDSSNKIGQSALRGGPQTSGPMIGTLNQTRGMATQGTQTSPNGSRPGNGHPIASASASANAASTQESPPKQSKSRRQGQSLRAAAQQRRAQQAYENYQNPPKKEDFYICEFCEYESIFGGPPHALIRQYEIKDRKARNKQEAQRRNLEKLKAKGRKNRKGAKTGAKGSAAGGASDLLPPQSSHYDPQYDPPQDVDSQGEEYFDDDYDETDPLPPDLDALAQDQQYPLSSEVADNGGLAVRPE